MRINENPRLFTFLVIITLVLRVNSLSAQRSTISGIVKDVQGDPIIGASVILKDKGPVKGGITDFDGRFLIVDIPSGRYKLQVSYTGFASVEQTIAVRTKDLDMDITLGADMLGFKNEFETGTFGKQTVLSSSVSITTINPQTVRNLGNRNLANTLRTIPGFFVDGSAGEVMTRVYARGIGASATVENGWFYNKINEDGLPVSAVSWNGVNPDLFFRTDATISRIEAVHGGAAAITVPNAPGGVINFISKQGTAEHAIRLDIGAGLQANGSFITNTELNIGGPLKQDWFYNIGGFYRFDQGARTLDYTANEGGQIKANLTKINDKGYFKFYGKYLNDRNVAFPEIPVTNWSNPTALASFDLATASTLLPPLQSTMVNGSRYLSDQNAVRTFDNSGLIQPQDLTLGFDFLQESGSWTIRNNVKYAEKSLTWNTSARSRNLPVIGNNPLALMPYQFTGYGNSSPLASFNNSVVDWTTFGGNSLGRVQIQGDQIANFNASFIGNATLPRNEVMLHQTKMIQTQMNEFMDELRLTRQVKNHSLVIGAYYSSTDVTFSQDGDGIITTVEDNPRILKAILTDNAGNTVDLMNPNGLTNIGGVDYIHAEAKQRTIAGFINDTWQASKQLTIDAGLRFETVQISGEKDGFNDTYSLSGLDNDPVTGWDGSTRVANGVTYLFDDTYNTLSVSVGANYKFSDNAAVFLRLTQGYKTPELTYYFNNFYNTQPIKGAVQGVQQAELGMKYNSQRVTFSLTAFYAFVDNINVPNLVRSTVLGTYSGPPLFNEVRTIGAELLGNVNLTKGLAIRLNATVQNAVATKWQIWNYNNIDQLEDDIIVDYSGNQAANVPNVILSVMPTYTFLSNRANLYANFSYLSEQWANYVNGFQLPSFLRIDSGFNYSISDNFSIGVMLLNALNETGIMSYGYASTDMNANPENATADYISANPDAVFYVRPILPRAALLKLNLQF